MPTWIRASYLTGLHELVADYAGNDSVAGVFGPTGLTAKDVADPFDTIDYSIALSVYDSLILHLDSVRDFCLLDLQRGHMNPTRMIGEYSMQGRSRSVLESWARVQSLTRLLVGGQQGELITRGNRVSIWADWTGYPGVGLPIVSMMFAACQIEVGTRMRPIRARFPFKASASLQGQLAEDLLGVEVSFEAPFAELEYDRAQVLDVPPLPQSGQKPISHADILRAYYPVQLVEGAVMIEDTVTKLVVSEEEDITLQRLSDITRIPSQRLQRHFAQGGLTVRSMVERIRVQQAEQRLADTTEAVLDVAMAVGYSSQQALTKAFKRWRGLTPTEYRAHVSRHVNESTTPSEHGITVAAR